MTLLDEIVATNGSVRIMEPSEGPIGAPQVVEVSGDDWELQRWFFFDEFDLDSARQFGVKTLNNPKFREAGLRGAASWRQIQDLYLATEETFVSIFEAHGLFEFPPKNLEAGQIEWAEHKLIRLLKQTHDTISHSIQEWDLPATELSPYLTAQAEAARGIAAMIDPECEPSLEAVRPEDRLLEVRSPDTRAWILEDNKLDVPLFYEVYGGEHGPIATLRAPYKLADTIKTLDWHQTHRRWIPALDCWSVDFDAIEQVIRHLVRQNFVVRMTEPVARLAPIDFPEPPSAIRPDFTLPTVRVEGYNRVPPATELLSLPGIGPARTRGLLAAGFASIPEVAHAPESELKRARWVGETYAGIVKQSAKAALGDRKPAAVRLYNETSFSLVDSQAVIVQLATNGVPQYKAISMLKVLDQVELGEHNLDRLEILDNLYMEGYRTVDQLGDASLDQLKRAAGIPESVGEELISVATNLR